MNDEVTVVDLAKFLSLVTIVVLWGLGVYLAGAWLVKVLAP